MPGEGKRTTRPVTGTDTGREAEPEYNREADDLPKKISGLGRQVKQLPKKLARQEEARDGLFQKENTDRIPVEAGMLVRADGGGKARWIIEVE